MTCHRRQEFQYIRASRQRVPWGHDGLTLPVSSSTACFRHQHAEGGAFDSCVTTAINHSWEGFGNSQLLIAPIIFVPTAVSATMNKSAVPASPGVAGLCTCSCSQDCFVVTQEAKLGVLRSCWRKFGRSDHYRRVISRFVKARLPPFERKRGPNCINLVRTRKRYFPRIHIVVPNCQAWYV